MKSSYIVGFPNISGRDAE